MSKPLTVWITTNWKILQEMGIPDHLTCLLRNMYAGQEATVKTGHGATNWSQIGKGVCQGCILPPWLFNLYTEYIMLNARLMKHKLESRLQIIYGIQGHVPIFESLQLEGSYVGDLLYSSAFQLPSLQAPAASMSRAG